MCNRTVYMIRIFRISFFCVHSFWPAVYFTDDQYSDLSFGSPAAHTRPTCRPPAQPHLPGDVTSHVHAHVFSKEACQSAVQTVVTWVNFNIFKSSCYPALLWLQALRRRRRRRYSSSRSPQSLLNSENIFFYKKLRSVVFSINKIAFLFSNKMNIFYF